MTKIMNCTCQHEFQDKEYGKSRRVFNLKENKSNIKDWRCTVCEKIIQTN